MSRDSLEDFKKKYRDTYCFLLLNGKEYLVFFADDNGDNSFYMTSPEFGEIIIDRETLYSCVRATFPKSGLYNLEGNAVEYTRVPERQWKRAPCSTNSLLYPILSKIGISTTVDTRIHLHNLETIFKEDYPKDLDGALSTLKYSVAINKDFAISDSVSGKDSELILWFKTQPVGLLNAITKEITVKYNHLYQEVSDFIRKSEPTWHLLPKQKQL